jgi:ElaB/YqjD/DUF883 family membrane-anchored ribosome-binding protein
MFSAVFVLHSSEAQRKGVEAMATTGKAQGDDRDLSQRSTIRTDEDLNTSTATRESDTGGVTPGQSSSGIASESESVGIGGLSSIPGGRSRSSISSSSNEAAEGWTGQFRESASDLVNRAQDVASDVAQRAQDIASQATDQLGTTIRRYPIQSLLIGFGIGCAVGMLLPSRR